MTFYDALPLLSTENDGHCCHHSRMGVFPDYYLKTGVHNAKAEECTTPYMRQNIEINIGVGGLHGTKNSPAKISWG